MIIARSLFMHCERNKSFLSLFIVITIITIFKFLRNIPRRRMIMLINTQAQPAFDHLVRWSHFTRITWPIRPSKNYYIKFCYINVNRLTRNAHTRSLCIFFIPLCWLHIDVTCCYITPTKRTLQVEACVKKRNSC